MASGEKKLKSKTDRQLNLHLTNFKYLREKNSFKLPRIKRISELRDSTVIVINLASTGDMSRAIRQLSDIYGHHSQLLENFREEF